MKEKLELEIPFRVPKTVFFLHCLPHRELMEARQKDSNQ